MKAQSMLTRGSADDPVRSAYFSGLLPISVSEVAEGVVRSIHSTEEGVETRRTEGILLLALRVIVAVVMAIPR